jgi:di/tricarboxylate transporter
MSIEALIVLAVIVIAVVLFATEILSIDLVAVMILSALVLSGVISPAEGVAGFSNAATITVAAMFVLCAALLKTGGMQLLSVHLATLFKRNFMLGMFAMMMLVAAISAFINNTPVVAIFIPIIVQVAHSANFSPSRMLIPLSFATIFGGTCSLIGTSTNILVSGIVSDSGLAPFSMFEMTPMGLVFLLAGVAYMLLFGIKILPDRRDEKDLKKKFEMGAYLTEIELLDKSTSAGKKIMDAPLVKDLEMDVIEVRRNGTRFTLPAGDMVLMPHDLLKVRSDIRKMKALKDHVNLNSHPSIKIGNENFQSGETTLIECIITAYSEFEGKTLREVDFRRTYRAVPLAIKHREEILHEHLYETPLKAGDVILAEVKTHHLEHLRALKDKHESPFIIISENDTTHFNRKKFVAVIGVMAAVVITATFDMIPIMMGAIAGSVLLVLMRCISMKEVYDAIEWKVIFLLAGALSLGVAMEKSGLANLIAHSLISFLGDYGPVAIVSGLYLITSLLTEMMSNNATAALLTPIAIVTAQSLGLSPLPFVMAITFAASASFMTPVGYQTNTMVYGVGQYRFMDFIRVGSWLNLLFWIIATLLIPVFFPF